QIILFKEKGNSSLNAGRQPPILCTALSRFLRATRRPLGVSSQNFRPSFGTAFFCALCGLAPWNDAVSGPERALHDHGIDPAPEFESDRTQRADLAKAECYMQADGSGVAGIADDRQHLQPAQRFGAGDDFGQQAAPDAPAMR